MVDLYRLFSKGLFVSCVDYSMCMIVANSTSKCLSSEELKLINKTGALF